MDESPSRASEWRRRPGEPWITPPEAVAWAAVIFASWIMCCRASAMSGDDCRWISSPMFGRCQGDAELVVIVPLLLLPFILALVMWLAPLGRRARVALLALYAPLSVGLPLALEWLFYL
ncbi:MAG TPA: hypothetical protein VGE07_02775 [Herpetosiphonaceae bacterium]